MTRGELMMKRVHTLALASLFTATGLLAQNPEAPPAPQEPKNFTVPAVTEMTLANGMRVRLVPYGETPKVTMRLTVMAAEANESAQEIWLSELTGRMLQEGTTSRSAQDIATATANMGGTVTVGVGANLTQIQADALSEFTPAMVKLIGEMVTSPAFPVSELGRIQADLARELSIAQSQQQVLANERFTRALYGQTHPYGRVFPTSEMLSGFTVEQVKNFHAANYHAGRAVLYVVGSFDMASTRAAITEAFGKWRGGSPFTMVRPEGAQKKALYVIDRPGAVQSTIMIGLPVALPSDRDWVAQQVTNAMLGGYFSSRITSNIREAKGYTYSPFSTLNTRQLATDWYEMADVTTNVTGPALKEIVGEIEKLRKEAPSEAELEGVQNYLAGNFILQNSSRNGILNQLQFVDLHGLGADYLSKYVERIYATTPADIQKVAQTHLDPTRMTIVVAGDRKVIDEQIKDFGEIAQ